MCNLNARSYVYMYVSTHNYYGPVSRCLTLLSARYNTQCNISGDSIGLLSVSAVESLARSAVYRQEQRRFHGSVGRSYITFPFVRYMGQQSTPLLPGDPLSSWSYFAHPSHGLKL